MSNLCKQCRIILKTETLYYTSEYSFKLNNGEAGNIIPKTMCNWCKTKPL